MKIGCPFTISNINYIKEMINRNIEINYTNFKPSQNKVKFIAEKLASYSINYTEMVYFMANIKEILTSLMKNLILNFSSIMLVNKVGLE